MIKKSCFVIGCTGQDGSLLCKSLLDQGCKVIGITRKVNYSKKNFIKLGINEKFKILPLDLNDHDKILELIRDNQPSEIYNLSAQSSVSVSFSKPIETYNSIINVTYNLLEICKKISYQGRIFFAGSSEIYGNVKTRAKVNDPKSPLNPYALAKNTSMNFVEFYRKTYQLNCITGVLFNHESSLRPETFITQKIITGAINSLKERDFKLEIGNINVIRDWGDAEEYVEGIQKITRAKIIKDQIICTGIATSLEEFIDKVFSKLSLNWKNHIKINSKLFRESDIKRSVGDPTACFKDTGWKSSVEIDEMISKLIKNKMNN